MLLSDIRISMELLTTNKHVMPICHNAKVGPQPH